MYLPTETKMNNSTVQTLYRFYNNYGASVIRGPFNYGNKQGLYELAVIHYSDDELDAYWKLCHSTPLTEDVISGLSELEVQNYLTQIEALTPNPICDHASHLWNEDE